MTDNDLIRRGDALYAIAGWEIPSTAIAALPAVTVGVKPLVWEHDGTCFRAVDPVTGQTRLAMDAERAATSDADRAARILAALDLTPAPLRYMGQIMAECDCPREAECQAAGRCIAEERK